MFEQHDACGNVVRVDGDYLGRLDHAGQIVLLIGLPTIREIDLGRTDDGMFGVRLSVGSRPDESMADASSIVVLFADL